MKEILIPLLFLVPVCYFLARAFRNPPPPPGPAGDDTTGFAGG